MKTALITGATSGIGFAVAEQLAASGYDLILASRNTAKMQEIAAEFRSLYGVAVSHITVDLSLPGSAQELYRQCLGAAARVDLLVNNAGIGLDALHQVDQPLEEVEALFELNCHSLLLLSTLFGKEMKQRREGFILNIASTAAFQPMPFAALYGASKAFVLSLSEAMFIEMRPYGVGVTAVCPGITDTNFFRHGKPKVPGILYRLISPELVARRALRALFRRRMTVVPCFQHWLVAQVSRFLTRRGTGRLMRQIERRRKSIGKEL